MARPAANAAVSVERFFQFSLLGLVASGYLAVAGSGYLDAPTIVLTGARLAVARAAGGRRAAPGILRTASSPSPPSFTSASSALDYLFLSRGFLEATVHLVFFLAVVKILTARTTRDYAYYGRHRLPRIAGRGDAFGQPELLRLPEPLPAVRHGGVHQRGDPARDAETADGGAQRPAAVPPPPGGADDCSSAWASSRSPRACSSCCRARPAAALDRLVSRRILLPGFSNQVTLGEIGEVKNSSQPVMHVGRQPGAGRQSQVARARRSAEFDGRKWFNPPAAGSAGAVEDGRVVLEPMRAASAGSSTTRWISTPSIRTRCSSPACRRMLEIRHAVLLRTPEGNYRLGHAPANGLRYGVYAALEDRRRRRTCAARPFPRRADVREALPATAAARPAHSRAGAER